MPRKKKAELTVPAEAQPVAQMPGQDQVLSIVMAELEEQLNGKKDQISEEIKVKEEQLRELRKQFKEGCLSEVKDFWMKKKALNTVIESLKVLLGTKVRVDFHYGTNEEKGTIKCEVGIESHSSARAYHCSPYGCGVRAGEEIKMSKALLKAHADIEALDRIIKRLYDRLAQVRIELSSLNSYERKAKAKIARIELQGNAEAVKYLEAVRESVFAGTTKLLA